MSKNNSVKARCPRCKIRCKSSNIDGQSSSICLTDGPEEMELAYPNDDDFDLRIWSFMEPPRISGQTPLINPVQLERIRRLIDKAPDNVEIDNASNDKRHIRSNISIQFLKDGSVVKTKSRTEISRFSANDVGIPLSEIDMRAAVSDRWDSCQSCVPNRVCGPDCNQVNDAELEEVFEKYMHDRQLRRASEDYSRRM